MKNYKINNANEFQAGHLIGQKLYHKNSTRANARTHHTQQTELVKVDRILLKKMSSIVCMVKKKKKKQAEKKGSAQTMAQKMPKLRKKSSTVMKRFRGNSYRKI